MNKSDGPQRQWTLSWAIALMAKASPLLGLGDMAHGFVEEVTRQN